MYILPIKFPTEFVASYNLLEETNKNPAYGKYVILLTTFRDVQKILGDKSEVVEPTCWKLYTSHIGSSWVFAWILLNTNKKDVKQTVQWFYSYIKLMKI